VITSQFEEDRIAAEEAASDMLEGGAGSHDVDFGADARSNVERLSQNQAARVSRAAFFYVDRGIYPQAEV